MSQSVNKVILVGNLGKDAELRTTKDGQKMVKLSLATKDNWKDKDGTRKERVEWHNVIIFSETIADIASTLKKGDKVYIEGQLQTRKWMDDQKKENMVTEVVLLKFTGKLISLNKTNNYVGGEEFKRPNNNNDYSYEDNNDICPF